MKGITVSPSHYAQYILEREGTEIVEDEYGFATYKFLNDGAYIVDIYVHPDYRNNSVASAYADKIADIARSKGLPRLYGSVATKAKAATASLKVLLAYGFSVHSTTPEMIYMSKEIS